MEILSLLVGHIIFAGVFAALVVFRSKHAKWAAGKKTLIYPMILKVLVLIGLVILTSGIAYMLNGSEGMERITVAAIMLPIAFLYFMGCLELVTTRIAFDDMGIYQSSIFARTTYLGFQELASAEYTDFWAQHVFRDDFGGCIRVSKFMAGAEELVAEVQSRLHG